MSLVSVFLLASSYARWQPSIYAVRPSFLEFLRHVNLIKLLRPMFPGQVPTVRRNMYNVVLVFDLARPSSLHFITDTLSMLINHLYPVRFGIVPVVETEDG